MIVTINCVECDKEFKFDITDEQYERYVTGDGLIQDIFSNLSPKERELFISGICPECWDKMFG